MAGEREDVKIFLKTHGFRGEVTPQQVLDFIQKTEAEIKQRYEWIHTMTEFFVDKKGTDKEYKVLVEGKEKWFRVYEPEGFFVYNRKYEVGIRAKPLNPVND